ncbi:MAG: V-type ATP synthase subunit F [Candidatus Woesearchaeota archaeon]|nr:V-type ATP synthase subunit F [Candidatus Woesearchaeota archaeon]
MDKMQIAVIGLPEFTLGFRLVGIRNIIDIDMERDNPSEKMKELIARNDIGIIISDEKVINVIDERTREIVERSVRPVNVVVSTEATAQETLRKMIIKSIGVDLWGAD